MFDTIAMVVVELESGEVEIQLFKHPEQSFSSFESLKATANKKPGRATHLVLDYSGEELAVSGSAKQLPVPPGKPKHAGVRLGEGPISREELDVELDTDSGGGQTAGSQ